jgi:uncharacterized membrane protein YfcA
MTSEFIILLFVAIGLLSGLFAGMLGIGGGMVTVPSLYYIFLYSDMMPDRIMQIAVGTSLAAAVITSSVSTWLQMKRKAIHFSVLKLMIPSLILGCIIGSLMAHYMPSKDLRLVFGFMALLMGFYFFFPKLPNLYIAKKPNKSLSLFSLIIGTLSSMLGIGGGSMTFPVLMGYQITANHASATSSASTLITTFISSIVFLIIASEGPALPSTFGYIDLPAFIAISSGSILSTPFGVKLSHVLHVSSIKRVFGVCLSLVGLSMLFI